MASQCCDRVVSTTSLGIVAKSLYAGSERRRERYRLQEWAGRLLEQGHRTCTCGQRLVAGRGRVRLVVADDGDGRHAAFHNVETCSSVWACPVCSARISERRRGELNTLLAWARSEGLTAALVTLTLRHAAGESLETVLAVLKGAKTAFHNSRAWRQYRALGVVVGFVTATEVTYGAHGWHPHVHMIVIGHVGLVPLLDSLRSEWEAALELVGASGNGYAYQVQDASGAGDYVGKWGAAGEMTLAGKKTGRAGSRGVWQLLADASAGDAGAGVLWLEYEKAMRGKRQLVWSRGLKDAAGLADLDDAEVLEVEDLEHDLESVESLEIGAALWAEVLYGRERVKVLELAEQDLGTCVEWLLNVGLQGGLTEVEVYFE